MGKNLLKELENEVKDFFQKAKQWAETEKMTSNREHYTSIPEGTVYNS